MKMLDALRRVDVQRQGNVRSRLCYLGYQPRETELLVDKVYLRFCAQFEDASEMTGYIDKASWLNQAMPELQGIDWLSVDENVLPALIVACPLKLGLIYQHSRIRECRICEIVRDASDLISLPALNTETGVVIIENFHRKVSDEFPDSLFESELQRNLPVPLSFFVGTSTLPLEALFLIEIGDVLLVEKITRHVKSRGKILFKFELQQESIMIIEHNDELLADDSPLEVIDTNYNEGDANINTLPVELSVILLEKTVTLGELKAILPGEVLTLPGNTMMDVEIRVNQRCFARGELVQLSNGQLGVEIQKIWP